MDENDHSLQKKSYLCSRKKTTMIKRLLLYLFCLLCIQTVSAQRKQWTVVDGLPTGEVHQIVELPNGQMLVNCEGVFCLSNGRGFQTIPCDYNRAFQLSHYGDGYSQQWQGDSLLWLQDFYRIFLFDTRTRAFIYDIKPRLSENLKKGFIPSPLTVTDRQGGIWTATMPGGITYEPPQRQMAEHIVDSYPLIDRARSFIDSQQRIWRCKADGLECESLIPNKSPNGKGDIYHYHKNNVKGQPHNKTTFITELKDHRFLLCDSLCTLGYFYPERKEYVSLNDRLPALNQYRHLVGACVINDQWTVVYSQNGAFLLDTKSDTLAPLPSAKNIERFSDKYNCMVLDKKNRLWIGTQNGLFSINNSPLTNQNCQHINGLANNCIRSLLIDQEENVWVGTSCGVSRVTPSVVNYGPEDGIPAVSMMERAALLTDEGELVFAYSPTKAVCFSPERMNIGQKSLSVVITAIRVNARALQLEEFNHELFFNHKQNNLTFQFSALNYATPSHTRYRYRLVNLEKEWQPYNSFDGSFGIVEYRALPPGTYTFEVQATIDNNEWGETKQIVVTIRPPLWLTWWAKALYGLIAAMITIIAIRFYLKRKREIIERENDNRVNRLFELREEARHQFAEATNVDPQKIGVNSEEQQLTESMLKAIETHMADADYGVDQLARDIFMSRSALYAKLRNMLGISPADFIRNVRLKRAAQLLTDTNLPIGEVADRVGYNTHKAFVANFKKMFGALPSEYRNPKNNNSKDDNIL